MFSWLKLSHHDNSGRLRPHEHTSYIPLLFLLLVVGAVLTFYSVTSAASPPPEASSIGLTGVVPGSPPTTPAVITSPTDQQHFTSSPISVSGTCPANTLVEIFKNDIFAGSTTCNAGAFKLQIDLLFGKNILMAKVFDALNQAGPDSNKVSVFYDVLAPQPSPITLFNFGGSQLLLNTDAVYRGIFPNQEFTMPIDILGGTPPYAINVQWGDANNKVVPRPDNTSFRVAHAYTKAGTYQISIQATDTVGRVAFLGVAAIVNGQPSTLAAATSSGSTPNQLLLLWPVYTSAIAIVISFWLGERREKRILSKQVQVPLLTPQG